MGVPHALEPDWVRRCGSILDSGSIQNLSRIFAFLSESEQNSDQNGFVVLDQTRPRSESLQNAAALRPHGVIRAVAAQRCGILEPFRARASFSQVQKKFHSEIRIQNLIGF